MSVCVGVARSDSDTSLGTAQNQLFVDSCTLTQPSCVPTWGRSLLVKTHQYQFPPGSKKEPDPPTTPCVRSDLVLNGLLPICSVSRQNAQTFAVFSVARRAFRTKLGGQTRMRPLSAYTKSQLDPPTLPSARADPVLPNCVIC